MNTKYYLEAKNNLNYIEDKITNDEYLNKLLYANIITILEKYLYNIFITLLNSDIKLLKNLTISSKFKNQKIPLKTALNDVEKYIFEMVKGLNYHNLSDIEPLFSEVLDIKIDYDEKVIHTINTRHNIIHRNGFNKNGESIKISTLQFQQTIKLFLNLILDIDNQITKKYNIQDLF